jgi:hypothetical protein
MASSLRVNAIVPASGTNVAIGTAGGTITYTASVSGVSTFSSGIIVAAGSTSAPSISPSGDSNTGIFFPSADTIAFGEGGVEALRINSSANIGIGTDNPQAPFGGRALHLGNTSDSRSILTLQSSNTGRNSIYFSDGTTGGDTYRGYIDYIHSDNIMTFGVETSERMRIDSSGRVTKPYQPFFYAKAGASRDNQTSNPTVFSNVVTNVGNHYDGTTNYRFTAPVAGVYLFTSQPGYKETGDNASWKLYKNGVAFTDFIRVLSGLDSHSSWSCAALVYLGVGDYVYIGWDGAAGGYHQNPDLSYFSGTLIG